MALYVDHLFRTEAVDNILDVRDRYEPGGEDELALGELLIQLMSGHVNIWTVNREGLLTPVSLAVPDVKTEFILRDCFDSYVSFPLRDESSSSPSNILHLPYATGPANAIAFEENPWLLNGWPCIKVSPEGENTKMLVRKDTAASAFILTGRSWCFDMYLRRSASDYSYEIYSTDRDPSKGIQVFVNTDQKLTVSINGVTQFQETGTHAGSNIIPLIWAHFAICREAGVEYRIYADGNLVGTFNDVEDTTQTDDYFYIGPAGMRLADGYLGSLSQARLTVDTPLFSGSTITPPGPYQ